MFVDSNQHYRHPNLTPGGAQIRPMPVDYLIKDLKIEHKTPADFYQSIIDKRIWKQAEIADAFVIEWDCNEFLKHLPDKHAYSSMLGALAALFLSWHKSIIFLPSVWMRDFLRALADREDKPPSDLPVFKKKSRDLKEAAFNLLCQIPQISVRSAEKICYKFNTLQEIANAELEDIMSLPLKTPAKKNLYEIWRVPLR